jgi:hypothetical protein
MGSSSFSSTVGARRVISTTMKQNPFAVPLLLLTMTMGRRLLRGTHALPKKHRDDVAGGARENRHPIREEHPPERDGGRQSGKSF